ncbi:MAG: hypothetical protein Q7K26_01550 [bacterium]|nr:hypothetical protein [bacterium]
MEILDISAPTSNGVGHIEGCLFDAVTVTGDGPSRKLLFASPHGILHFIKIEESYGERSATLLVQKNDDNPEYSDLVFNAKTILIFANNELAMKAYTDAYHILLTAFDGDHKDDDAYSGVRSSQPHIDNGKHISPVLIVLSILTAIIVCVFLISISLRLAGYLVPWEQSDRNHEVTPSAKTYLSMDPIVQYPDTDNSLSEKKPLSSTLQADSTAKK